MIKTTLTIISVLFVYASTIASNTVVASDNHSLTVIAHPSHAQVRVMNIVPKYTNGIQLKNGSYDILVKADGYQPLRTWITLNGNRKINVVLSPTESKEQAMLHADDIGTVKLEKPVYPTSPALPSVVNNTKQELDSQKVSQRLPVTEPDRAKTINRFTSIITNATPKFTKISTDANPEQLNPLEAVISVKLPKSHVHTVSDAVNHLLRRSGYTMNSNEQPELTQRLLRLELPQVHRDFSQVTLNSALQALAGPDLNLVIDHIQRKVFFKNELDTAAVINTGIEKIAAKMTLHSGLN